MAGEAVLVVEHEEPARAFLEQQLTDDGFGPPRRTRRRTRLRTGRMGPQAERVAVAVALDLDAATPVQPRHAPCCGVRRCPRRNEARESPAKPGSPPFSDVLR